MPLVIRSFNCGKQIAIAIVKDGKCVKVWPRIDLPVQVYEQIDVQFKTMVEREQERGKPFTFKLDQYDY